MSIENFDNETREWLIDILEKQKAKDLSPLQANELLLTRYCQTVHYSRKLDEDTQSDPKHNNSTLNSHLAKIYINNKILHYINSLNIEIDKDSQQEIDLYFVKLINYYKGINLFLTAFGQFGYSTDLGKIYIRTLKDLRQES